MSTTTASLDVFILTFNAAKQQVDAATFAHHLRNAFAQNATSLPELVVFCLQEMAPLANAFIGSYMLSNYYQSFESAVNLAASSFVTEQDQDQDRPRDPPYTLVTTRNAGMTGIMLLSRNPAALLNLRSAEVGLGAGDMANKGAVGLRMLLAKEDARGETRHTELTFVSAHLAAMEWNLEKRNRDWEGVVSGLLFEDPKKLLAIPSIQPTSRTSDSGEETEALLSQDTHDEALHNISIYKPGSHLFVGGDLNYRISETSPTSDSDFPDLDPESPNYFPRFLAQDQLMSEKAAGRTLHGLSEAAITFPPTYKLDVMNEDLDPAQEQQNGIPAVEVVSWKWAAHRWPGWCDRVLYLDIPRWASRTTAKTETKMNIIAYDALPAVRTSDHRAVFLRLQVPVLEPSALAPPDEARTSDSTDPRVKLPYPVDPQAWKHRAYVKKWESVIGWSMLASQSKQGIAIFVTLFLAGLGTWWFRSQ
ncbi:DNase I-like protein [Xylariaceae sp. AK1471]|nr:DNase I-like protein [Xylariaceae sp. AK1471]